MAKAKPIAESPQKFTKPRKLFSSLSDVSEYTGIPYETLKGYQKARKIEKRADGKWDTVKIEMVAAQTRRPLPIGDASLPSAEDAKIRKDVEQTRLIKLKADALAKRLVDEEDVRKLLDTGGRIIRDRLLAMPSRIAPAIAMMREADVERRLTEEVRALCEDAANELGRMLPEPVSSDRIDEMAPDEPEEPKPKRKRGRPRKGT